MIASGEKKEEYRKCGLYWAKRLLEVNKVNGHILGFKPFKFVVFHKGYSNTTIAYHIDKIVVGNGREEWGGDPYAIYYVIKLGQRVEYEEDS